MKRFELIDGKSSKFWEVAVDGASVTVRFGRIGTAGQTQTKPHATPAAAQKEHDKLVAEKTKKGYQAVGGDAAPAAPAVTPTAAVTAIRALAAAARSGREPLVRTYLLDVAADAPRGVLRAGGAPIGVTPATRPRSGGAFMQHLVTLDLDAMPEVRAQHAALAKARALAVFTADARAGDAETAVIALTAAAIAGGEWAGDAVDDPPPRPIAAWSVDVPARVFTFDRYGDGIDDDAPIAALHDELMSACRAGGPVIHWSGDPAEATWVFQLHDALVEVNLGDAGTMYVLTDRAYWTGH